MKRYAIIKDGIVANLVDYESQPETPPPGFSEGHYAIENVTASIGWTYLDGVFTNPNPTVFVARSSDKQLEMPESV